MIDYVTVALDLFLFIGWWLDNRRLQAQRRRNKVLRWLARYNYERSAALQDRLAAGDSMTYRQIEQLIRQRVETCMATQRRNLVGQSVPLDKVPENLRDAAKEYNLELTNMDPEEVLPAEY